MITFTQPGFLVLLALLPLSVIIALPRLRRRWRTGETPAHAWAGVVIRCLILACIVLALAGAQSIAYTDRQAVVFLVDRSDSIGAAGQDDGAQFIRDALARMRPDGSDQAAVVVFGADAQIDRGLSASRDLAPYSVQVRADGTDIENAIRLGLSLLPPDFGKRLVLLSDGLQTAGDAASAARLARAVNARLDVVAMPSRRGPDAAVERVDAPPSASVGQVIPLQVMVRSNTPMRAQLSVYLGPDLIEQQNVNLVAGENQFTLRATATRAGFSDFRARIIADSDVTPQNDALSASVVVGGKPRILLVANPPGAGSVDETSALKAAFEAAGIDYEETTPRSMPSEIPTLASYPAVVLVNVPARDLSLRTMFSLQSYVRDVGGGLVVIGGPSSYGVGGYFKTPLEETLPLDTQVKDPRRFPSVAMAIVMDKSGSMSAQEGGIVKIRLAAEAAARAAELINDDDEITVIGYDTQLVDQVGPFAGRDRQRFIPDILKIAPGGGGIYIFESLSEARRIINQTDKRNKFVILLADGSDAENQAGAQELVRQMRSDTIVLSVVAIGDGADVPFLTDLAAAGGGRFHLTDRAANLPTIFTEETAIAQRSYIVEQPTLPRPGAASPFLSGIDAAPALQGYVATTPKPAAQVSLWANDTDPLLAQWQYGLGRVVAFTSDATGRWGRNWVTWPGFPRFWAQVIRWTILERADTDMQARVMQRGDRTVVQAELPVDETQADPQLTATVLDSAGASVQAPMQQTAPGRYEAETVLDRQGAYFVRISSSAAAPGAAAPGAAAMEKTLAWVKPYSPEYAPASDAAPDLAAWAEAGGGTAIDSPAAAFATNAPAAASRTDLFPLLLALAAVLLPFDIATRRITVSLRNLLGAAARREPAPATIEQGARVSRLMVAKTRSSQIPAPPARPPAMYPGPAAPPADGPVTAGATASELLRRRRQASSGAPPPPPPAPPPPTTS